MVERFAFHHPQLYSRGLLAVFILVAASGLGSVFAYGSSEGRPRPALEVGPHMQPPVQQARVEKVAGTTPAGWEGVKRLPGKSGSGSVSSASSTRRAAATTAVAAALPQSSAGALALGRSKNAAMFGDEHWPALQALWSKESNWNPAARNPSSGACGIPQALPCSKIKDMSTQGQIDWGLNYIKQRYGTPTRAWRFWLANRWY